MAKKSGDKGQARLSIDEAVSLRGQGRSVRARFRVANPTDQPLDLTEATVYVAGTAYPARVSGIVPPGQSGTLRVAAPLSARLAPGKYDVEVEIGGVRHGAQIVVVEQASLLIEPSVFIVTSLSPASSTRDVVVANQGNVPLDLPEKLAIGLSQDEEVTMSLIQAVRTVGKEGFESVLDAAVANLAEIHPPLPALLRFSQEGGAVKPGETRTVELTIEVPDGLKRNFRYSGFVKLYDSKLRLSVEAHGPESGPKTRSRR